MQQFVAYKKLQLLDAHKELFYCIFGEARTHGLKKMLWFYPQPEYPEEKKLAEINTVRKAGLLMFLGHDEKDISQTLSQEQNLSPVSLSQLQSSQVNISQLPILPAGSRKLQRGAKLTELAAAQIHENAVARINLGMDQRSSSSKAEEQDPEHTEKEAIASASTVPSQEY